MPRDANFSQFKFEPKTRNVFRKDLRYHLSSGKNMATICPPAVAVENNGFRVAIKIEKCVDK